LRNIIIKKGLVFGIFFILFGVSISTGIYVNNKHGSGTESSYYKINQRSGNYPEEVWNKSYGGPDFDFGMSGQQTTDNGYIILGYTDSFGAGGYNIWLIKTDSDGNEQWNTTYGGSYNQAGLFVQQTSDNGYIIIGCDNNDICLIKTDSNGNEQWNKIFGGSNDECGYEFKQTNDGGLVLIGYTRSFGGGGKDVWLIKIDSSGNEQVNKTFGGIGDDSGFGILQNSDEGFIITGNTESYGEGDRDVWLIKTDSSGNEIWNKTYGGIEHDSGSCLEHATDGGYILLGSTKSYGPGGYDYWLIKTDESGSMEWNKTFGGLVHDNGYSIKVTCDEGYIIAGGGFHDVWLIKTDTNGNEIWNKTYGGDGIDFGMSVQELGYEKYIIFGTTSSYGAGGNDVWLLKVSLDTPPNTVYVDDNYDESTPGWQIDHFDKIQDGIYTVNESGTVLVYNGTYYENVVVNKSINLIGENKNTTIIDGSANEYVIFISVNFVNISEFTIRNSGQENNNAGLSIYSSNCVIKNNIITNNKFGIYLEYSSNNIINNNIIIYNQRGIYLKYSSYNIINNNVINYNSQNGISLPITCNYNIIKDNNISKNNVTGIYFVWDSNYNQVLYNTIFGNSKGISMDISKNCDIIGNIIKNNRGGVYIRSSSNILLCNNIIKKSIYQAAYLIASSNITVKSNIISETYSDEINGVGLLLNQVNNSSITQNSIISNVRGFLLIYTSFCFFSQNNISNNSIDGINFRVNSRNNTIEQNLFLNNYYGIYMGSDKNNSNNNIFHNNFINNTENAYDDGDNIWDAGYPSCGNYWSDYPFRDGYHGENQDIPGLDRVGDKPYNISSGPNKDNYPVMDPYGWLNREPVNITHFGPPSGKPGEELSFYVRADDPERDPVYYLFDWGDNTTSGWFGRYPYPSGATGGDNHSWEEGEYEIRAKAKDTRGFESEWSEPVRVSIPRSRFTINSLLLRFYERFFYMFPMIKLLLGRILT
jgi:parallel beta-helix repeat protein